MEQKQKMNEEILKKLVEIADSFGVQVADLLEGDVDPNTIIEAYENKTLKMLNEEETV